MSKERSSLYREEEGKEAEKQKEELKENGGMRCNRQERKEAEEL